MREESWVDAEEEQSVHLGSHFLSVFTPADIRTKKDCVSATLI